jgi:hypothetical protein
MCIEPSRLKDGTLVACRYCWQCRANRVNDLVGRCIAEQSTSDATLAVTLTYAGDVVNSALLVYPDFQRFMKRLRKAGFNVRYIVAGEYGSKKGRAHWHAILFFKGKVPDVGLNQRLEWEYWPHGFSYFQQPDYRGFKYVLKYTLKDTDAEAHRSHLAMSKKPPLGHEFFMDLANKYVEQHLAPQSPKYSFRDVFDPRGKRREFWLQGRMRELFLEYYLARYKEVRGCEPPFSEFVTAQEDKWIAKADDFTDEQFVAQLGEKSRLMLARRAADQAGEERYPEAVRFVVFPGRKDLLLTVNNDGTATLHSEETEEWQLKDASAIRRALEMVQVRPDIIGEILRSLAGTSASLEVQPDKQPASLSKESGSPLQKDCWRKRQDRKELLRSQSSSQTHQNKPDHKKIRRLQG